MNRFDFILFYEKYAIQRVILSKVWKKNILVLEHLTENNPTGSYDFELEGKKYDVKYAHPGLTNKEKKIPIWSFDLRKKENRIAGIIECDYFVLLGLLNGLPQKVFLIPSNKVPTSNVRISIKGKSKYYQYEI